MGIKISAKMLDFKVGDSVHVHMYLWISGFNILFWLFFPRLPNCQIKNPAKFSHYMAY